LGGLASEHVHFRKDVVLIGEQGKGAGFLTTFGDEGILFRLFGSSFQSHSLTVKQCIIKNLNFCT